MSNQRPRRVGIGMKPRQSVETQGISPEDRIEEPDQVSESGVQTEVPEEVEAEVIAENSEGGDHKTSSLQNLDSETNEEAPKGEKEGVVAQNPVFDPPPAVPQEAFDNLAALVAQSEEVTGAEPMFTMQPIPGREFSDLGGPTLEQLATSVLNDGKGSAFSQGKQYAISIDHASNEDRTCAAVIRMGENGTPDELVEMMNLKPLGELPNGEYRATVRVGEGYIEGIKSQAEADGVSLEDWLTQQLQERLEQWFFAAGAR